MHDEPEFCFWSEESDAFLDRQYARYLEDLNRRSKEPHNEKHSSRIPDNSTEPAAPGVRRDQNPGISYFD
jgi:hypothetical protein